MEPQKETPFYESIRIYKDLAMTNQATKSQTVAIVTAIQFDLQSCVNPSADLSFQVYMHRENAEAIKEAASKYLQICLLGGYSKALGFKDAGLYRYNQGFSEEKQANILDALIVNNRLLKEEMKKRLCLILKQEVNLSTFFKQIHTTFGLTVGRELAFLIYQILKEKYQKYKQAVKIHASIFPKLNCYQYLEDGYRQLTNQSPVFDQINLEEIALFAEKEIEIIGGNLYFADSQIQILNLKEITAEINPKADLLIEFVLLLKQISKSVFLSLAGGTLPVHTHGSLFDIPRDFSFTEFSEMNFNKSLSRMPGQLNQDEKSDFVAKKIKTQ